MFFAGLILGLSSLLCIGLVLWELSRDLPDLAQLKQYEPRLATHILDRNGEILTELYTQRRIITPLERVPQHAIDALLATEDRRFFEHWGMDLVRVLGAATVDVLTLSTQQGASTITQQLARDLYLHKRRTVTRKLREVLTAVQIERNYSKREILEMYLTQIYFGHGAYGLASAAQKYFGVPVERLNLEQSALLAALPKAPARYSPRFHYDRALKRRNLVLHGMYEQGFITRKECTAASATPIEMIPQSDALEDFGIGPYFTEMVRQQLSEEGRRLGFNYLEDGLTVQTTLDARMQRWADKAAREHLGQFQSEYRRRFTANTLPEVAAALGYAKDRIPTISLRALIADSVRIDSLFPRQAVVQVALVALEPQTGDILALLGGRDFGQSKFNRAVQAIRQPGSAFKPFTYIAAIDNGYPPTYQVLNQDVVIVNPDGTRWMPQNYDLSHGGLTTLREGLRQSLNLVSVRLVQEVVPPRLVRRYARQMGISTPIDAVDAIALGASGVYPIEITSAFSCLANGGVRCQPRSIVSIEDRFGEPLSHYPMKKEVALDSATAYIITDMLASVIDHGTGGSARWRYNFYPKAAGKTGTTNDFTDAWFVGFTPRLACGVWVGLDDPAESLGPGQSGASAALPIWANFMKTVYDSLGWADEDFVMPRGVVRLTICKETKELATPWCPERMTEIFREDAQPLKKCHIHKRLGGGA